jgi:hypothetical protein
MAKHMNGMYVLVIWDDGTWTVGEILSTYRGHRNQIYIVVMSDGITEKVYDWQIVSEIY